MHTTIQGVNLMYSPSRAISQGCTQATPIYIKSTHTVIVSHHTRVDLMYSPSRAISQGQYSQAKHAHIHKIDPYIVACIPPYKGWSYVLFFQSNQPGMYPKPTHL